MTYCDEIQSILMFYIYINYLFSNCSKLILIVKYGIPNQTIAYFIVF